MPAQRLLTQAEYIALTDDLARMINVLLTAKGVEDTPACAAAYAAAVRNTITAFADPDEADITVDLLPAAIALVTAVERESEVASLCSGFNSAIISHLGQDLNTWLTAGALRVHHLFRRGGNTTIQPVNVFPPATILGSMAVTGSGAGTFTDGQAVSTSLYGGSPDRTRGHRQPHRGGRHRGHRGRASLPDGTTDTRSGTIPSGSIVGFKLALGSRLGPDRQHHRDHPHRGHQRGRLPGPDHRRPEPLMPRRPKTDERDTILIRFTGSRRRHVLRGRRRKDHPPDRGHHPAARGGPALVRAARFRRRGDRRRMTRVAFVVGHEDSTTTPSDTPEAYWRVLVPARAIGRLPPILGAAMPPSGRSTADVVWIHQPTCFAAFALAEVAKQMGKAVVVDWGEDIYRRAEQDRPYSDARLEAAEKTMAVADIIVVASAGLAPLFFPGEVRVVPARSFPSRPMEPEPTRPPVDLAWWSDGRQKRASRRWRRPSLR